MALTVGGEHHNGSGGIMGTMIAVLVFVILGFFFFAYGYPALRKVQTQINVPNNEIDLNVDQEIEE